MRLVVPDLAEVRARGGEDLGYAEPTTDLDQLAPADDDFLTGRQGGQDEEHRRRPVVHHNGGFRTACLGQQAGGVTGTVTAVPLDQVELDIGVLRRRRETDRRPAQVGVEQDASGVDHRLEESPVGLVGSMASPALDVGAVHRDARGRGLHIRRAGFGEDGHARSTSTGCGSPVSASDLATLSTDGIRRVISSKLSTLGSGGVRVPGGLHRLQSGRLR